jgi:hypothetical protein
VLGTRALQIAMCAPIMVELQGKTDSLLIAMRVETAKNSYNHPTLPSRQLNWSIDDSTSLKNLFLFFLNLRTK